MKTRKLYFAAIVLAFASVQLAFSWGNATHVYFAKQLGAKFGFSNMNEMYGSLLIDCFNFDLTVPGGTLSYMMHNNAMPLWGAAKTSADKSLAFGFMTHNQTWGGDYTAHVKSFAYPNFTDPDPSQTNHNGYVIAKGYELVPQLLPAVLQILTDAGVPSSDVAMGIAPALGHDLCETAIDLLVKRNIDRLIGARMLLSAQCRPASAGALLAKAYAGDLSMATGMSVADAKLYIIGGEKEYQKYVVQYGMAFSLPEKQTIALLSQQTVPIAEMFITAALDQYGIPHGTVIVTAEQIAAFIVAAIDVVQPDYAGEVDKTLCFIEKGLRQNGINAGFHLFAHDASEASMESIEEMGAPTEFALAQNTPNPFNPSTMIGFSLPAQGHVRLTVFNALGQEVATLVDGERPAGSHVARWDAMNQPSGAYFYRIESGSFVETKRMMLVR